MEDNILVAVASKDGRVINQHFGHAERFLIYRIKNDEITFLEERKIEQYCRGVINQDHEFEEDKFMDVLSSIKDCKYVLVSRIGYVPETKLRSFGITPIMMYDKIEEGIKSVREERSS